MKGTSVTARRILLVLAAVMAAHAAQAARPPGGSHDAACCLEQVDKFVLAEMQRQKVPGVAIGIVRNGEPLIAKGYGEANVELGVPVTPRTIFQSGSVGKQFTAVALMLQVEDGKLGLDDSVTRYLPDAPPSWRSITIRHLLTHTSGIPDYTERTAGDSAAGIDLRRDYTEDELAKAAFRLPLQFEPGSRWSYSNTGYLLLGIVIHKVSGRFYGDVLKDRVFTLLGMKTARIISEEDIVPNRAAGYRLVDRRTEESGMGRADAQHYGGRLTLSIDARSHRVGPWTSGRAILKPESWSLIYAPVSLPSGRTYPYGFGWFLDESGGKPWYHHSGSWQGFETYISRYLGDDVTIIVLTNLGDARPGRFVDGIAAIIDAKLAKLEPSTPIRDREPAVTQRVRALLVATRQGNLSPQDLPYIRGRLRRHVKPYQELLRPLGAAASRPRRSPRDG